MDFTQYNSKDPLRETTDRREREFIDKIGRMCNGASSRFVKVAAINILLQAIRADHANAKQAVEELDYLTIKARDLLLKHFYPTGSRQNIFPYTQNIDVPLMKVTKKGVVSDGD